MPEVFIDTAGWASLFVKTEPYHLQALRIFDTWSVKASCSLRPTMF